MKQFTEVYFDDALRLAQFLAERFNEEIKPVEMDAEGFPMPPKGEEFGERTQALIVGDYAIAFFRKRTSMHAKHCPVVFAMVQMQLSFKKIEIGDCQVEIIFQSICIETYKLHSPCNK